jgi:L-ascorbate metabolism protein UlaG (beta-lactamase superfamily)
VSFARLRITYIGGPTALIEIGGLRLLTDPTFDPAGGEYQTPSYSLFKLQEPALDKDAIGQIDAVLLSHDHHFDNLDNSGRSFLNEVPRVLTTEVGAARLEGRAEGLAPWQSTELTKANGDRLTITATPARHGPAHADRGPCIGFIVSSNDSSDSVLYLSGDTVWYDGVAEVARRYSVAVAVLFMGAARVEAGGPWHLTFTGEEGVEAACAFGKATIVPLHYEGWAHFTEHRDEIDRAFDKARPGHRLYWLRTGVARSSDDHEEELKLAQMAPSNPNEVRNGNNNDRTFS